MCFLFTMFSICSINGKPQETSPIILTQTYPVRKLIFLQLSALISIQWRRLFYLCFVFQIQSLNDKEQQMSMYMLFIILAEIKNQIENRLHCIDLLDDDCISIPYSCKNSDLTRAVYFWFIIVYTVHNIVYEVWWLITIL